MHEEKGNDVILVIIELDPFEDYICREMLINDGKCDYFNFKTQVELLLKSFYLLILSTSS